MRSETGAVAVVGLLLGATLLWGAAAQADDELTRVERCQVVNPDATTIEVRLDTTGGSERTRVEQQVVEDLDAFLRMNGAAARCAISVDRPQAEPSGKVKQVIGWWRSPSDPSHLARPL